MADDFIKAIVLTERVQIRESIRAGLRAAGISSDNIAYPVRKREFVLELIRFDRGVIILDWEFDPGIVIELMQEVQKKADSVSKLIFLISQKVDEKIIIACNEFGVSKVHTGNVTGDKIKRIIEGLVKEINDLTPLKKLLKTVASLQENGEWEKSGEILERLSIQNAHNQHVSLLLIENYMKQKEFLKAYVTFDSKKKIDMSDPRALFLKGKCLLQLGKTQEAVGVMKKAKILNPYHIERLMEIGNALLKLNQSGEAMEEFDEIIKISPNHRGARKGKGACLLLEGEVNEALRLLKGKVTGSELASVFNTSAVLSIRSGRFQDGMTLYDSAVSAVGKDNLVLAKLYFNKGIGFVKQRKKDEASECFAKALELDPKYQNAAYNLGILGDDKAVQNFAKNNVKSDYLESKILPGDTLANLDFDDSIEISNVDSLDDEDEFI